MKIEIGRLRKEPGAAEAFDFFFSPEEDEDCVLLRPIHVVGTLTNGGNGFSLAGRLEAGARLFCGRCLAPVERDFSLEIREDYGYEEFPETDPFLDLADIAGQIWNASIPMRVLCREDCRGLCPRCGKDLNEGDCSCPKEEADPRLAALGALLHP
jgi:uncharacterized protein